MKKFLSFLILSLCAVLMMPAQTITKPSFVDNTYVGVTVGADAQVHDWDFNGSTAGLRVGKMITPHFGVEVAGQARFTDFYKTITSHRVGLNALGNINELFFDGKRDVVEFVPYVGLGWQRNYHVVSNDMYTSMGVYVNFNVSDKVFLTVVPQFSYVLTGPTGLQYNINRADLGVSVGAAYRLGKYFQICDKKYTQNEWEELNAKINQLRADNELLANRKPEIRVDTVEVIKEIIKEVRTPIFANIGFEQNSDKILKTNALTIKTIAKHIKSNNKHYTIYGYASVEGSKKYNQRLSQNRANAVRNALIKAGVPASRLTAVGKGSTSQFGGMRELNRTIVIE